MAGEFTWPTFAGEDGAPEVEIVGGTSKPIALQSGGTYVVSLSTEERRRYTFRYAGLRLDLAAPDPYQTQSEVECAASLLAALHGGAGACYVVDPIDGLSRLCQLEADSITFKKVQGAYWWAATISFRTV